MSDSEDDFEQELLQAVGRAGRSGGRSGGGDGGRKGGGGGGNRRSSKGGRSRRSGFRSSSSSEDQPSDNEDDDDEYEDIEERERARGARGSAGAEGKTDTRSRGNVSPPRGSGFRSGGGGGGGGSRGGGRGSGSDEDRRARGSGGGDGDSESSGLSFGSDLYKDDDDRERLQAMNEIDREQILFERDERRRNHLDKRELRKKLRQQQKLHPQQQQSFQRTQERTPRASAREPAASPAAPPPAAAAAATPEPAARGAPASGSAPGSAGGPSYTPPGSAVARARGFGGVERSRKEDALQQLEAKKAAKQQRRNDLDADRGADRDASDDGGSDDALASRRKPPAPADRKPPASWTASGASTGRAGRWLQGPYDSPSSFPRALLPPSCPASALPPSLCSTPPPSRPPSPQYKFEGRMTCKFLDCKWGEHRARWQMARVSDKPATTQEILQLFREIERAHLHRVTKAAVQEKKAELESVRGYVYSAEVVASMLREKRAAAARPKLVVMERERVRLDIAAAEQRGDLAAVEQLKAELEKLERIGEDKGEANKGRREVDLARMNKRNRQENFRTATNAPAGATENKTGEAAVDPFIRRWTRSQNYYKSPASKSAAAAPWSDNEEEGAGKDGGGKSKDGKGKDGKGEKGKEGKGADGGKGGGAEEEEREKEREKERERQLGSWLGQQLDERAKQVLRKHAFDMDIDLTVVDKWGGAGAAAAAQRGSVGPAVWEAAFLARKRQQEALYGAPIGVAAGETPRGLRLLTLSEYKRRRGLPCD
ncbi:unnamed protein product [Closterium sp. Yama58-4]|nr:unnamed protein product [Closterium sp. Yama58-4]